jgi:hypothetical protein
MRVDTVLRLDFDRREILEAALAEFRRTMAAQRVNVVLHRDAAIGRGDTEQQASLNAALAFHDRQAARLDALIADVHEANMARYRTEKARQAYTRPRRRVVKKRGGKA